MYSAACGYFVVAILLAACAAKTVAMASQPHAAGEIALAALHIAGEGALAWSWLRCGATKANCVFTLVAFGAFAVTSGVFLARGETACGCFGDLPVPPLATLILDLSVVALVASITPSASDQAWRRSSFYFAQSAGVLWVVAFGGGMASQRQFILVEEMSALSKTGQRVVLEPGAWAGKRLPVLGHVVGGQVLRDGRWRVALVRQGCSECEVLLERIKEDAAFGDLTGAAWAVISVNGELQGPQAERLRERGVLLTCLDPLIEWHAKTPIVIALEDGVCRGARTALLSPVSKESASF